MRRRNTLPQDDQHHREMLLRPPDKTWKENLRDMFWDPKNKTCFTRTPLNWCTITIYYFIFVTIILSLFILAMVIVYFRLNVSRPQYMLDESPIGTTPCLNFFPLEEAHPLIWISPDRPYDDYVKTITDIFDEYIEGNANFSTKNFGECADPPFGYDKNTPCIFFRLNRILLWKPTPYKKGDDLPQNVPNEVKTLIEDSPTPRIWVTCEGSTPKDRDHLVPGYFKFQGTKGFDISVYPFDMQENFADPIIALQLNGVTPKKTVYSFTCSAWSKEMDVKKTQVEVNFYME